MSEIHDVEELQYQIVASRRQGRDELMWQVPVLSLTAQAFLFTIALGSDMERSARIVSAVLALVASIASIQLMAKHRHHEEEDSKWLEQFETARANRGFVILHARRPSPSGKSPWVRFVRISSYRVWLSALLAFGFAALFILSKYTLLC